MSQKEEEEEEKKPTGCGLIFCFFIVVLLGMLLVPRSRGYISTYDSADLQSVPTQYIDKVRKDSI
jgi:hypothetical protein